MPGNVPHPADGFPRHREGRFRGVVRVRQHLQRSAEGGHDLVPAGSSRMHDVGSRSNARWQGWIARAPRGPRSSSRRGSTAEPDGKEAGDRNGLAVQVDQCRRQHCAIPQARTRFGGGSVRGCRAAPEEGAMSGGTSDVVSLNRGPAISWTNLATVGRGYSHVRCADATRGARPSYVFREGKPVYDGSSVGAGQFCR